jgi:pimeloyl-ACP methyl ester carboxylesterase
MLAVAALFVTLAIAPVALPAAGAQEASPIASPAAGAVESTVSVDGRSLHVACAGTGGPTILFEIGGPNTEGGTEVFADIRSDLASLFGVRFCSYDRAGTGQSDPDPAGVRSLEEVVADFLAVLASPALACPCVVIGESLGGGIALTALAADPTGFAGLILLDSVFPGYIDAFIDLAPAGSPEAASASDAYMLGENEERLDLIAGFRQVTAPTEPPAIPIVVVSHGTGNPPGCFPCSEGYPVAEMEAVWQTGEAELARALGGRLVVAEGVSHDIAGEAPELVIGLVSEVVAAVLDPSTWATPTA